MFASRWQHVGNMLATRWQPVGNGSATRCRHPHIPLLTPHFPISTSHSPLPILIPYNPRPTSHVPRPTPLLPAAVKLNQIISISINHISYDIDCQRDVFFESLPSLHRSHVGWDGILHSPRRHCRDCANRKSVAIRVVLCHCIPCCT